MKITVSTKDIPRCSKKGCTYRGPLDRHHLKHEMMFIKIWEAWRGGRTYRKLLRRYQEFNPKDWRYLCRGHHGEIHEIYDGIIQRDRGRRVKFLSSYTWVEARKLMAQLKKAYFAWVKVPAKESNPPSDRLPREGEKARMVT